MLPTKRFHRGLTQLDRADRIRVGLLILGLSTEEAAELSGKSHTSVRIALSTGRREGTLKALEKMLDDRLP